MCGRFTLKTPNRVIVDHFELFNAPELAPRYNVAPSQSLLAIRLGSAETGLKRETFLPRWGLVPSWSKEPDAAASMINARGETVAEKPAYRTPFKRSRCLIPADGFFEWSTIAEPGKKKPKKTPHYFQVEKGGLFAFAGLYDRWRSPDGSILESTALITISANSLVGAFHDRMPVILDAADYPAWLGVDNPAPDELLSLVKPFPPERMMEHVVSTLVNSPRNDVPECVQPAETIRQPDLFA